MDRDRLLCEIYTHTRFKILKQYKCNSAFIRVFDRKSHGSELQSSIAIAHSRC
jgi:hypothetical protein